MNDLTKIALIVLALPLIGFISIVVCKLIADEIDDRNGLL